MSIQRWADDAMFPAQPIQSSDGLPKVHLLWITPDPLGAIAAMARMYEGKPCYSLDEITDDERRRYFESIQKTKLQAPFEAVKFHFFVEGISRSTTHQMVRQRTAVYAQESLRFAVKEKVEVVEPPTIRAIRRKAHHSPTEQSILTAWDEAVDSVWHSYNILVQNGIPAEDARELLPHATATRIHYVTDLRNLVEHAGNRLCTQAVPIWRVIFTGIVQAIREFGAEKYMDNGALAQINNWQMETIADSMLFRPACYQKGKCPFSSDIDRGCTIRSRVDDFHRHGVPSSEWHNNHIVQNMTVEEGPKGGDHYIHAIKPEEWLLDINAGRTHRGDTPV